MYAYFEDTTEEEFKRIMGTQICTYDWYLRRFFCLDVNYYGAIHGVKVALPLLRQTGGGSLIVVSSIEARRTLPLMSAYAASKHGKERQEDEFD
jgi:NAD(P)-dependent dehydrogenase (short-subunit alcohol dehydrogenase family)